MKKVRHQIDSGNAVDLNETDIQHLLKELFPAGDPLFQEITWDG